MTTEGKNAARVVIGAIVLLAVGSLWGDLSMHGEDPGTGMTMVSTWGALDFLTITTVRDISGGLVDRSVRVAPLAAVGSLALTALAVALLAQIVPRRSRA